MTDAEQPADDADLLDSTKDEDRLYIERKAWVTIRVEEEHFDDSTPAMGLQGGAADLPPPTDGQPAPAVVPAKAPYVIVVSLLLTFYNLRG